MVVPVVREVVGEVFPVVMVGSDTVMNGIMGRQR